MKTKLILIALAAMVPFGAMAQFDSGASVAAKPAWESFKLPKKTLKLDFRNANIDMVLSIFTKASGITIVKDPALTQPLTLTSATAVSLNQAFEILNATLSVRNFELKKEGNLMVIRAKQQNRGGGGMTLSPDILATMGRGSQSELKVYQIQFANASQVARVLNDVFAQAAANPFAAFGGGAAAFTFGGGRRGQGGGTNPMAALTGGGSGAALKASSDDYSNTVIVNAPSSQQKQVEELIKQIDKETDKPAKARVYKLNFVPHQGTLRRKNPRLKSGGSRRM